MAIPDYQTIMLPLLRLVRDGVEHRIRDAIEKIATEFALSDEEKNQLLPSGTETVIASRTHWAKTYLSQAKLLQSTRRAHFQITNRGREALNSQPTKIDITFLRQFPEFKSFLTRRRQPTKTDGTEITPEKNDLDLEPVSDGIETPDEVLRTTIRGIDAALSNELLDRILAQPPAFFENLIVSLLLNMGYGGSREDAGKAIGKSGDGGIDGVIDQDPLGLDRVYVQAKRYKLDSPVSEPEIRGFSGSLGAAKANKGVFVTTSYFTKQAHSFAERHPSKMILIDGNELTKLMIRYNVGVRIAETLHLKKLDEDFFSDE